MATCAGVVLVYGGAGPTTNVNNMDGIVRFPGVNLEQLSSEGRHEKVAQSYLETKIHPSFLKKTRRRLEGACQEMKKYKPVSIKWVDSGLCSSTGWESLDDLDWIDKPIVCYTAGFLIEKNKKMVRIASSINQLKRVNTQVGGVLDIPIIAIKKLRYLK